MSTMRERLGRLPVVFAALLAVGTVQGAVQAPTAVKGDAAGQPSGKILFTRQLNRQDDLFILRIPEGRLERLTDHRAKDSHGIPSPDGRRIVFNSERAGWWKIWLMNADGTGIQQLTNPKSGADYYPAWSSDGKRIVFASGSQGNGDIISMAVDGSDPVNLTQHPSQDNFPAWSPTGEAITFASEREGSWGIYLMGSDGTRVRRITEKGDALEPAWFPDGRRLVFQSNVVGEGGSFDLWALELKEGVTSPPTQLTRGKFNDKRPAVSPDGKWIVFESDRAGGSQLFALPSAGGDVRQLTTEGYCFGASWFPAGGR